MKFTKKKWGDIPLCYAVGESTIDGVRNLIAASEVKGVCKRYDLDGNELGTVWTDVGGVMSIVGIPNGNGAFFITQDFYSPDNSMNAYLSVVIPTYDHIKQKYDWEIKKVKSFPFLHRVDIINSGDDYYLLCCTLKSGHLNEGDWNHPGYVAVAKLDDQFSISEEKIELNFETIVEGLYKNHGYSVYQDDGFKRSLISSENGVFELRYPNEGLSWQYRQLIDFPASDAIMMDLNGDGVLELVVFSPFHGDEVRIYKKEGDYYRLEKKFSKSFPFLHALSGFKNDDSSMVLIGYREGEKAVLGIFYNQKSCDYELFEVDKNVGPANFYYFYHNRTHCFLAANREAGALSLYTMK